MSVEYNEYLNNHISNVSKGFEWLVENLPEVFDGVMPGLMRSQINAHDDSKWWEDEYEAYDDYFYGNRDASVEDAFDLAWLHHQHNNPHHWQHWLLREDNGGTKALEMPKEYVLEMICDWWAFSWSKGKLTEIFDWYATNKPKMVLHPNTLQLVEDVLTKIRNKVEYGY
jgi:hypothetical protein